MSELIPRYSKALLPEDGTSPYVKFKVTENSKKHAYYEIFMMYPTESQHTYGQKIAKALNKPKQIFGYDPCEYGFYYNHLSTEEEIKSVKRNMFSTHEFEFPSFKINSESKPMQKYVYDKLCEGYYNEWEKYQRSFYNSNGFDGDTVVVPGDFSRHVGNHYARGIEFMRNLQFIYPDMNLQELWDLGIEVLQTEISGEPTYKSYFSNLLKKEREAKALRILPKLKDLSEKYEERTPDLQTLLSLMGLKRDAANVRTLWNRLKSWHKNNIAQKGNDGRKKAWKWLETAELKEMEFEKAIRLEKENKDKEKQQQKRKHDVLQQEEEENERFAEAILEEELKEKGIVWESDEESDEEPPRDKEPPSNEEPPRVEQHPRMVSPTTVNPEVTSPSQLSDETFILKYIGDVQVSSAVKEKTSKMNEIIKKKCKSYVNSLQFIKTVGPKLTSASMGNKKYVCTDKEWVERSQFVFSTLFKFVSDLNQLYGQSLTLKKLTNKKLKLEALKRICEKLQFGNNREIDDEKKYIKSSESWLPFIYTGAQFVKLMLFLEDWMGAFHNSKEVTAERMEFVKELLDTRCRGYSDEERSTISIAFITIADWD